MVVRALRVLGEGRAQEPRVRGVVRARVGLFQPEVGDDRHLLFHRLQRGKDGRELAECLLSRRRPASVVASHRDEDEAEPAHRSGRGLGQGGRGGNHRVEERQRERRLYALQERAPRQRFLRNDHDDLLI